MEIKSVQETSLQKSVKNQLRELIKSGTVTKLPSEQILSQKLGVSRTTLRSVLTSLENEGLVVKKHGVGTFVNLEIERINIQINKNIGYFDLIKKSGHTPSMILSNIEEMFADEEISNHLKIEKNNKYYRIEHVFAADGIPAIYIEENVPEHYIEKSFDVTDLPESIFEFTRKFCNSNIQFTIVDIIPYMANEKLMNIFKCAPNEKILLTEETHLDNLSNILVFSKVYSRDKFIRFQVTRTS